MYTDGKPRFHGLSLIEKVTAIAKGQDCKRPAEMNNDLLWTWVCKMLRKEPEKRPLVSEFLEAFEDDAPTHARKHQWPKGPITRLRSNTFSLLLPDLGDAIQLGTSGAGSGTTPQIEDPDLCDSPTEMDRDATANTQTRLPIEEMDAEPESCGDPIQKPASLEMLAGTATSIKHFLSKHIEAAYRAVINRNRSRSRRSET